MKNISLSLVLSIDLIIKKFYWFYHMKPKKYLLDFIFELLEFSNADNCSKDGNKNASWTLKSASKSGEII